MWRDFPTGPLENRGKRSIVWRCVSRLENTGLFCDARTVLASTIEQVLVTAINTTLKCRDSFLATLQNNIATVLSRKNDAVIEDIEKRIAEMSIFLRKQPTVIKVEMQLSMLNSMNELFYRYMKPAQLPHFESTFSEI